MSSAVCPDVVRMLTTEQVADRYQLPKQTVVRWRHVGKGPAWVRLGDRLIRYRLEDLEAFEQQAA
ncbi:helix-turn-helix transcriptional regulator [Nocardia sp. NPDC059239]|uniref:helix-turn-helix transcriptional regulator n=1 Tax=unclassified Nocardia TaxID=2637762 RepID=UPI00369E94CB